MIESILSAPGLATNKETTSVSPRLPIAHSDIRRVLPHAGAMCLLDSVRAWDEQSISCVTRSHRSPSNPLRGLGGLASANGIEYAAQAMALHAALVGGADVATAPDKPAHGVLASVRSVRLRVPFLDVFDDDLLVSARLLSGDPMTALYEFSVHAGAAELLTGRASVMFNIKTA